jgi:AraC-like DNA-binding protein
VLLKDFIPPADLRDFVQTYRIVHFRFGPGQEVPSKAYPPRPEQCLAFYPFDREAVKYQRSGKVVRNLPVVLYGQFSEVTERVIGPDFLVLQVVFHPGAIYRLTGMPSSEITNQYLDAHHVFGPELTLVNEQLYHANGYAQMLDIAGAFIRGLIRRQKKPKLPIDDACAQLLGPDPRFGIDMIARESCLGLRQLERRFKERTGVNPKLFERIIRFDQAFRLRNSRPDLSWLRIAMECNYHDYQHLAREYRDFTGLGPNAFHAIEEKAPERTFGLVEGYYTSR